MSQRDDAFCDLVLAPKAGLARTERDRASAPWRAATHCLLGLLLGVIGAAVQRERWNQSIHWANAVPNLALIPAYLGLYSVLGYGLWRVATAATLIVLSEIVAFNTLFYVLHKETDPDYLATPLVLLAVYLAMIAGIGLAIRVVRRCAGRGAKAS